MRTVLFHTYHFPPIGGSGAQRPLKMVRALEGLGYRSIVVTGGGATADRWAPEDTTLAAEIPPGAQVHRLASEAEPAASVGLRRVGERWLGLTDRWASWWRSASYEVGRSVGSPADLIYVWMQPYASAETGARLSRSLQRPWVADLGDPWALDEMMIFASAFHRRRALREMRRVLGTAAAIVMSTPEAVTRLLHEFPELGSRPVTSIPNGFDPHDFEGAPEPRTDRRFRIVHTGYLHTQLGLQHHHRRWMRSILRASPTGLDILTRSHVYLVEALDLLLGRRPDLEDVVELHLAGVLNDSDRRVADRCKVAKIRGYLTHAESIALMQSANLLFLPMQNLPHGSRATIVPGKTYEYLASGSPILAAVPDGDARDILERAGNAELVRPDDVEGMADALLQSIESWQSGTPPPSPDPELVGRFQYGKLARELADIFDLALGRARGAQTTGGAKPAASTATR
jgi:glycosyltransferase involved in cell wall biosynthesis